MSSSPDAQTKTASEKEIEVLNEFPCEADALAGETGVLLSDQIKACVTAFDLIKPFKPEQLRAASYRLTVGERYALGGKIQPLSEDGGIEIEPFQVVVIQTLERINMPRNMIARWNIKVSRAYEGLLWAGGPQVDPGYVGHLFCPIYNLSDRTVTLRYGDAIAVIDFIKTTPFREGCLTFKRPPDAVLLEHYQTNWRSALHAYAAQKVEDLERKISGFEGTLNSFVGITFAVIGVLVAVLAIRPDKPVASILPTVMAFFAIVLSIFSIIRGTMKGSWKVLGWVVCGAILGGLCVWMTIKWPWS